MSKDKTVGVLSLYTEAHVEIEADILRLLGNIANQIGVALDNARLYEETKALALHDALTGLANRRLMDIFFQRSVARARRTGVKLSLIMADIDYFKKYNDSYGHAAGDVLLAQVASIISSHIREADLVVRYGGEEFLVLLPEEGVKTATAIAERIRGSVAEETTVTISLGVAEFAPDMTQEELIVRADSALYRAKDQGRNRVEIS